MAKIEKEEIIAALSSVMDPELGKNLVELNMIKDINIKDQKVMFTLVLTTPECPLRNKIETDAREAVLGVKGVSQVVIKVDSKVPHASKMPDMLDLPINHIIAVASGKGGVGKSTIAVNISVALAQSGARVGLLDADFYGPNIPVMMGVRGLPVQSQNQKIIPGEAYGVKVMSTGFLVKDGQPLIWRGPLLHSAVKQFLSDVEWGELDYLIVDLPPGTGDVQLSLAQTISLSGGIIVTTPQEVSLEDAGRALEMFIKLNIPVLGIIENMSLLTLPDATTMNIFGEGGGLILAEKYCVPLLGKIELYPSIREGGDTGKPIMISQPDSQPAREIRKMSGEIAAKLSIAAING